MSLPGRGHPRRLLLLALGVAVSSATGMASAAGADPRAVAEALPPGPVAPAFTVERGLPLPPSRSGIRWAPVLKAVIAHAAPDTASPVVARLAVRTPEQTSNIVLVLARQRAHDGKLWVRVRLPALANGGIGWLPRSVLGGYQIVHTRLVVDLERFRATLFRDGKPILSAPVGVGKPTSPTPRGDFYIRERVTGFDDAFYGPLAFGTSARSRVLTEWPGGGFIGIHGTNMPQLLPGRISHGCIRMRNDDILRLGRLMPVGTPVTIR